MKKWNVKYTRDGDLFKNEVVEAETYTTAYVAFGVKHADDEFIDEIIEIKE